MFLNILCFRTFPFPQNFERGQNLAPKVPELKILFTNSLKEHFRKNAV
jgi:hypothetical protein